MVRWILLISLLAGPAMAQTCPPDRLPPLDACAGPRVRIALVGDVLIHEALARRGYAQGFDSVWGRAAPLLRAADLAIANLEGPVAPGLVAGGRPAADPGPVFDNRVHTDYPAFNYHPVLLADLRRSGVDVVTTANNHALDRGPAGAQATLVQLDAARLAHVGSVMPGTPRWQPLRLRTAAGPLSLIACTYSTNGIADPQRQVPRCYQDREGLLTTVRAEAARGAGVLVLPHWGQEYSTAPDRQQRGLARALAEAGALAVVGTHPHVPQPWETVEAGGRRMLAIYSTGNFVAAQPGLQTSTAPMVWLDVCRTPSGMTVGGAGYVAMQMRFDSRGPVLTLPRAGDDAQADAGLALLARLIPGRALSRDCRAQPGARPPPDR